MKTRKFLMAAICLIAVCLSLKAQICNTPAPPPPAWLFNPPPRATNGMTPPYTMRVFVHIVRSSTGSGLGSNIVSNMITKLNTDYAGTQIAFQSGGFDFIDDNTFYNQLDENEYALLFSTNSQTNAIDIYVLGTSTTTPTIYGNAAGYASSIPSTALWIHGSVYNTSVLSHEMGHCLGLYHTHHGTVQEDTSDTGQCAELVNGSNATVCGDYIADTPADPNLWNGCSYNGGNSKDSNGQLYNPNPSNYMAYSSYTCWTTFTSIQRQRMIEFIENTVILQNVVVPSISGPTNVCPSSTITFTIGNAPPTYTWGYSSNLTPVSGSPGTFTTSSFAGDGWVSINVGGSEIVRKNIKIGNGIAIDGPDAIVSATTTRYYADPNCSNFIYTWVLHKYNYDPAAGERSDTCYGKSYVDIVSTWIPSGQPPSVNPHVLKVLAGNNVVAEKYIEALRFNYSLHPNCIQMPLFELFYNAYPNPASTILNIEIDHEAIAQARSMQQNANNGQVFKADPSYDIRLYNDLGVLLRQAATQGGKVEFNVANLPNAIYYLHIYDDVGSKPEMKQIVVQH